ncbi:hypothetical protein PAHAL_9G167200 [Panicum hallii]|jgi:hypothetical protein|uniref:NAC domain-containing protein n=1 Tax=Panicum hallii TaxID=206008 RepID=A0A2S3IK74_9POAL|nr:uncharacterized protein LOC112872751 [Panicum hallii]PAN46172.1 hypothetical protein PAHAL_9G167200 [Panicum hallii]
MAAAVVRAPSDHDLITFVLRPMAAAGTGQQGVGVGGFVHMADVYSVAPEKLAERYAPAPGTGGIWYFVCPARCRYRAAKAGALGEGCWTSETGGAIGPVRGLDGRRVGQSRALCYGARTAVPWTAVTRHGWCMVELALDDQDGGGGGEDFVLCKLFRSPRNEASSATAAAAALAAVPALVSSCKRKAAGGNHPEAPPCVRQQLMQRSF